MLYEWLYTLDLIPSVENTPLIGAQPVLPQQAQPSEVIIAVDPNSVPKQDADSKFVDRRLCIPINFL